ncbi:MAG: 50S ribosomal protein L27 [Candidatus Berkelbacteria bacterium]|nr:50S ribosomal protein L27 [Candidatus Berkelbacteria bacterium]
MAHTKAKGTTKLGRDSTSKRLGIKLSAGQIAHPGNIIIRQRGTKFVPGTGVKIGNDYTIFAILKGKVTFEKKKLPQFTGKLKDKSIVSVKPI